MTTAAVATGLTSMRLYRPGTIGYDDARHWQAEAAVTLRAGGPEAVALLQHTPTYSLGRHARREHLLVPEATLRARGAAVVQSDRGGDATFHGPGQLVVYPVLDLRQRRLGAAAYVRLLEQTLLRALDALGVQGQRIEGRPGVWVAGDKIAAIGVRIADGVSQHGCALNVDTDLSWFEAIVPCGIADAGVTSLARLGVRLGLAAVEEAIIKAFGRVFEVQPIEAAASTLRRDEALASSSRADGAEAPSLRRDRAGRS